MNQSNFLISISLQKAKEIKKEERVLMLSNQEWSRFEEILNTPQKPTQALRDLMDLEGFDKS